MMWMNSNIEIVSSRQCAVGSFLTLDCELLTADCLLNEPMR